MFTRQLLSRTMEMLRLQLGRLMTSPPAKKMVRYAASLDCMRHREAATTCELICLLARLRAQSFIIRAVRRIRISRLDSRLAGMVITPCHPSENVQSAPRLNLIRLATTFTTASLLVDGSPGSPGSTALQLGAGSHESSTSFGQSASPFTRRFCHASCSVSKPRFGIQNSGLEYNLQHSLGSQTRSSPSAVHGRGLSRTCHA